ncbi:Ig-like domain repeat protein [Methanobrevibacter wolinii]|uniref:Ig-like domain repeat protein n=1 Tax=Methanobrevibacter wolinii TaxID=190977 RepID=UPI0005B25ECE|nr:Ig-like domain repeat protein [Methanobrevibacter wolinii]
MNILEMIVAIFEKLFTKKQYTEEKVETVDPKNETETVDPKNDTETVENSVEKVEETTKKVKLDTYLVGENITITEDTYYTYKVKLLNKNNNNPILNKTIQLKINDKNYIYTKNQDGTYTFPIKLTPGTYTLTSYFDGDDICNPTKVTTTVVVQKKKQTITPNTKGEYWNPRYLTGTSLKQINSYFCAPVSISQVWYELYGTDESQTEISRYASTTVAGTSHTGINNALQKLASKYGKKISVEWKNYSDMSLQELAEIVADPNRALILHVMWHNLNNWNDKGGHYTTLACVNPKSKYVYEIYSLSGPELIKRSADYMKTVTGEISQQSVCIITKIDEPAKTTTTTTTNNNNGGVKGLFVKSSDSGKISFTELKQKGYNHIFLSHMIFEDRGEEYVKKFHEKCKIIGAKLIIFYTTYYNGSGMVNPTSSEAKSRIQKIISIGKKDCVDGVCLDYNRHNSNNHNDNIMNTITSNTNNVVTALSNKEVYATCMYEHPDTLKSYYHQDIGKWKATPLPMAYKYNYNYTDYKMNEIKQLIQKTNNKSILIFQNYLGDNNVRDVGSSQLQHDIQSCKVKDYVIFRYGTGAI